MQGQRCSFAVQMWAYHLGALRHDLWQVLSNDVAAKLFGGVLVEGLVTLSKRYSGVKPSKRRLPQMKYLSYNYLACNVLSLVGEMS